jgi:predicted PurR-regulated permease PerM
MLEKIKSVKVGGMLEKHFQRALNLVYAQFSGRDEDETAAIRRVIVALIRTVIGGDHRPDADDYEAVRHLLKDHSAREISQMLEMLDNAEDISAAAAAAVLDGLPEDAKRKVISELLMLAVGNDRLEAVRGLLKDLSGRIGIPAADFDALENDLVARDNRRRKIIKSGAGVAVALIVILVFILTATLLRSVIFGLIGAYIMLPVEKYFERRLSDRRSLLHKFSLMIEKLTEPLRELSRKLRRTAVSTPSREERTRRDRRKLIAKAVSLTGVTLLLVFLVIASLLGVWTMNYVEKVKSSVADRSAAISAPAVAPAADAPAADAPAARPAKKTNALETALQPVLRYIDNLRDRLDRAPLVQYVVSELSKALNDEATQSELMKLFLQRTGGIFSFAAGLVGYFFNLLLDVLLTIFFFLLFLTKIAEFCASNDGAGRQSEYLVRTVFNGNWLPGANEDTIAEAERIISEVINKLRVWLKGYLSLVLLDATVYTTIFYFLNVPYFFILGPLAGCGILLPFIGPIASAALTLTVTLLISGSSVSALQIFGIVAAYLIYNGIIEQFILYPVVIGESLGLSTLETIIVVLLGAIFAGITGMIFAIPAAAVLKYLVPQIYHCLGRRPGGEPPAK